MSPSAAFEPTRSAALAALQNELGRFVVVITVGPVPRLWREFVEPQTVD